MQALAVLLALLLFHSTGSSKRFQYVTSKFYSTDSANSKQASINVLRAKTALQRYNEVIKGARRRRKAAKRKPAGHSFKVCSAYSCRVLSSILTHVVNRRQARRHLLWWALDRPGAGCERRRDGAMGAYGCPTPTLGSTTTSYTTTAAICASWRTSLGSEGSASIITGATTGRCAPGPWR